MSNEQGWCAVGAAAQWVLFLSDLWRWKVVCWQTALPAAPLSPVEKSQPEREKYSLDGYDQHTSCQYCTLHPCVLTLYQSVVTCDGEEGD